MVTWPSSVSNPAGGHLSLSSYLVVEGKMLIKVVSVVLTGNLQPSCPYSSVFTRTDRFSGGKGSSCPGFYKSPHVGSPWIGGSSLGDSAKRLMLHIIRLIVKSPLGCQLLLHYPYIPSVLPWGHHIIGAERLGLKMGACLYSQLLRFQKPVFRGS